MFKMFKSRHPNSLHSASAIIQSHMPKEEDISLLTPGPVVFHIHCRDGEIFRINAVFFSRGGLHCTQHWSPRIALAPFGMAQAFYDLQEIFIRALNFILAVTSTTFCESGSTRLVWNFTLQSLPSLCCHNSPLFRTQLALSTA